MKIKNPKITMLINRKYTEIEIIDSDANTTIAKVKLTPEQLSAILSREGYVDCECTTGELSRIGKKHEHKQFEFEIIDSEVKNNESLLLLACNEALSQQGMAEWIPDKYFRSHGSFFTKDGKDYARATIRRWV